MIKIDNNDAREQKSFLRLGNGGDNFHQLYM